MMPHIHIFRPGADSSWRAAFAVTLDSVAAERGGLTGDKDFLGAWLHRQMDFINTLFCPEPTRVFAVRHTVIPDRDYFSAGHVEISLLCCLEGASEDELRTAAIDLQREVARLLVGAMPDYGWRIVTCPEEFTRLWRPFEFSAAHVAEIRRREDVVKADTMQPRPMLGRGRAETGAVSTAGRSIFYIHPFLPRPTSLGRLLRTLLQHRSPVLFQAALSPVWLEARERDAIASEIAKCDDATAPRRGGSGAAPHPHAAQAGALHDGLLEKLVRLQDAPFLLQVCLASPEPLPPSIVETAGVEITYPPSHRSGRPAESSPPLFGGGFDTVRPASDDDLVIARSNLENLDVGWWGPTGAPKALGRICQLADADEASAAFRFPAADQDGLEGIEVCSARRRPLPQSVARVASRPPAERLCLGENRCFAASQPAYLLEADRRQHMYVVGQTGTGKTSLLKTMIMSDIEAGRGLAVIDPHGDLYREIRGLIPPSRQTDVVLLDPTDTDHPVGMNLLECRGDDDRHFVAREMRAIMERLIEDQYGPRAADYAGPVFFQHMQMNILLAMSDADDPGTLLEFYEIYQHKDYWRRWIPIRWKDPTLQRWVTVTLPNLDYTRRNNANECTWGEYLSSKFDDFVFDPKLRLIFGQKRSAIDIGEIMDEGKILLVNLAKGELAESNARFLGMVLMAKIQAAAMERIKKKASDRRMFYLYVDEFQSLATQSFITMLSEARKFGLGLILANQFFSQIKDQRILESIAGNVGTTICFRLGREDAEALEPQFLPHFDRFDLANLPNWNACVRTTVSGQIATPFSVHTLPPPAPIDPDAGRAIKRLSRKRYGRPRAIVEAEIKDSHATKRRSPSSRRTAKIPLLDRVEEILAGKC